MKHCISTEIRKNIVSDKSLWGLDGVSLCCLHSTIFCIIYAFIAEQFVSLSFAKTLSM